MVVRFCVEILKFQIDLKICLLDLATMEEKLPDFESIPVFFSLLLMGEYTVLNRITSNTARHRSFFYPKPSR